MNYDINIRVARRNLSSFNLDYDKDPIILWEMVPNLSKSSSNTSSKIQPKSSKNQTEHPNVLVSKQLN